MSRTIELPADWEAELQEAARRQGKDVMTVLRDGVRQQLRQDILPETDSKLFEIINAPLAPEARQRRDALLAAQAERALSEEERETLAEVVDAVEIANARRWQAIAELAQRRGRRLAEVARELGIPLP